MFDFIKLVADGSWQGHKWEKEFNTLFAQYPELVMSSYIHELEGKPWEEYCTICREHEKLAESKCSEIVARFKQLTGIV